MPSQKNDRLCALDLFAGAGGISTGLTQAGIDVKYKVDINKTACCTLLINSTAGSHVFCEDIAKFKEGCEIQRASIYPSRGEAGYIHGSPPCQGVSAVNTSGGANDQQNNDCTLKYVEVVQLLQPTFVSMENVPGLGMEKNIKYLLRVVGGLLGCGMQVRTCTVVASHFGDAQDRPRLLVLASKRGFKLPVLKSTHGGPGRLNIVTARDALLSLEDVEPVLGQGLVDLPNNGGHVFDHNKESTELTEQYDSQYLLSANLPANTVRKGNQIRHYKHDRYITARERARLQSFPDSHRFAGTRQEMFDQIGNAVPCGLAAAIGRAVMESYQLGRHV
mgnify:CR=1 FL=1